MSEMQILDALKELRHYQKEDLEFLASEINSFNEKQDETNKLLKELLRVLE